MWIWNQTLEPRSCNVFYNQIDANNPKRANTRMTSNCIIIANKNNFASNWNGGIELIYISNSNFSLVNFTQRLIALENASFSNHHDVNLTHNLIKLRLGLK
jgi:hypothetical protein